MSKSEAVSSPVWEVSEPNTKIDNSTIEKEWQEIRENRSDLSGVNTMTLYTTDREAYYLPSEAMVEVNCEVLKADGSTVLSDTDYTALIGNGFGLFEQISLKLDEQKIAQVDKPGVAHHLKSLVEYSKDYADSVAEKQWFYPDDAPEGNDIAVDTSRFVGVGGTGPAGYYPTGQFHEVQYNVSGATGGALSGTVTAPSIRKNPDFNSAFKKRVERCWHSNGRLGVNQIFLPMAEIFPILAQYGRVLKGSRLQMDFQKIQNTPEAFFGDNTGSMNPIVKIHSMAMWLPRLRPSLEVRAKLDRQLASNSKIELAYEHLQHYYDVNRANATGEHRFRVVSEMARPLRALVAIRKATRKSTYDENSLQFDIGNITSIQMRVNGRQFPEESYDVSGTKGHARILHDLHQLGQKDADLENGSLLNYKNWKEQYPIFGFDLSHLPQDAFQSKSIADLEVRITGDAGANYDVHVVLVSERKLSIDLVSNHTKFKML